MVPPPAGGLGEGEKNIRKLPDTMTAATITTVIPNPPKDQEERAISVLSQPSHPLLKEDDIVKNLASFNDQNKKVESSAEIYRDQSLV